MEVIAELYGPKKTELNYTLTDVSISTTIRDDCCQWLQFLIKLKLSSIDLIVRVLPILQIMKIALKNIQYDKYKKIFDETSEKLRQVEMNGLILTIQNICSAMEKVTEDFGLRDKIPILVRFFSEIENLYCEIVILPQSKLDDLIFILEDLQRLL